MRMNPKHGAGIRVELMNKIGLLAKNLIILSNEVGTNLQPKQGTNRESKHHQHNEQTNIDVERYEQEELNTWAALTEPGYEEAIELS